MVRLGLRLRIGLGQYLFDKKVVPELIKMWTQRQTAKTENVIWERAITEGSNIHKALNFLIFWIFCTDRFLPPVPG